MNSRFNDEEYGYSKVEVNKFVDDVIDHTESMLERIKKQQVQINDLKAEVEKYKKLESSLQQSILASEEASSNIKRQAVEEGKNIIMDARRDASRIVNDALLRAEKIEIKADTLERNMRIFKRKLRLIVDQQLSVIDEIDEIELK